MGRGPKWSDKDTETLVKLYLYGYSRPEIAAVLDRTKSAIDAKMVDLGVVRKDHGPLRGVICDPRVRSMAVEWRGKKSASEIAEMCGVSRNSIISHWRRAMRNSTTD